MPKSLSIFVHFKAAKWQQLLSSFQFPVVVVTSDERQTMMAADRWTSLSTSQLPPWTVHSFQLNLKHFAYSVKFFSVEACAILFSKALTFWTVSLREAFSEEHVTQQLLARNLKACRKILKQCAPQIRNGGSRGQSASGDQIVAQYTIVTISHTIVTLCRRSSSKFIQVPLRKSPNGLSLWTVDRCQIGKVSSKCWMQTAVVPSNGTNYGKDKHSSPGSHDVRMMFALFAYSNDL